MIAFVETLDQMYVQLALKLNEIDTHYLFAAERVSK